MRGKRRDGQTAVSVSLSSALLSAMDDYRGERSRSEFVREALKDKLLAEGEPVEDLRIASPDRVGIGGRPPLVVRSAPKETPPSKPADLPPLRVADLSKKKRSTPKKG